MNIGNVPGLYNYEKESRSIIGYISLETTDKGINTLRLHSEGRTGKNGDIILEATNELKLSGSNYIKLHDTRYMSIDILKNFSLTAENVEIGNSCILKRQKDDGYGAYILQNLPDNATVKLGMSGATGHYCYIEHWNGDIMARLELYVNKDGGATLMLKSKQPNELMRSQPIAST